MIAHPTLPTRHHVDPAQRPAFGLEPGGQGAAPEDRFEVVSQLFSKSGGKLLAYYMPFGEYDFLVVSEGPYEGAATSAIIAAASGGVTDLKTTLAMTSADMKAAFEKAGPLAASFKAPGTA